MAEGTASLVSEFWLVAHQLMDLVASGQMPARVVQARVVLGNMDVGGQPTSWYLDGRVRSTGKSKFELFEIESRGEGSPETLRYHNRLNGPDYSDPEPTKIFVARFHEGMQRALEKMGGGVCRKFRGNPFGADFLSWLDDLVNQLKARDRGYIMVSYQIMSQPGGYGAFFDADLCGPSVDEDGTLITQTLTEHCFPLSPA